MLTFFKKYNSTLIILAIVGSILAGVMGNDIVVNIATVFGELFIKFLKLISIPILFLAIITSFINMHEIKNVRWISKRIFNYTVFTTIIAATLACFLYLLIDPLQGVSVPLGENINTKTANVLGTFLNMFPDNIFTAFANYNVIGIAIIAVLIGLSFRLLPSKEAETIKLFFSGFFNIFKALATYAIYFLPIGIWCFGTILIHNITTNTLEFKLIKNFVICVIAANVIQGAVIIPLLLYVKKISPLKLFKEVLPALTAAFFSKSSSTTLPVTIKCLTSNNPKSEKFYNFSLPLCTIINMNGCAAFIYIAVLFSATYFGMHFSILDMLIWIVIATCVAIGNASVPMGCYFLASALLAGMGVPLKLMALILPVYTMIDMLETGLNVWSDCAVTAIVEKEWQSKKFASSNTIVEPIDEAESLEV